MTCEHNVLFKSNPKLVPETTEDHARLLNFCFMSAQHVEHKPWHWQSLHVIFKVWTSAPNAPIAEMMETIKDPVK